MNRILAVAVGLVEFPNLGWILLFLERRGFGRKRKRGRKSWGLLARLDSADGEGFVCEACGLAWWVGKIGRL